MTSLSNAGPGEPGLKARNQRTVGEERAVASHRKSAVDVAFPVVLWGRTLKTGTSGKTKRYSEVVILIPVCGILFRHRDTSRFDIRLQQH